MITTGHLVTERFRGKVIWKGDVEVNSLTGHPKAKRCYGWSYGEPEQFITMLELPPATDAESAVKVGLAYQIRKAKKMKTIEVFLKGGPYDGQTRRITADLHEIVVVGSSVLKRNGETEIINPARYMVEYDFDLPCGIRKDRMVLEYVKPRLENVKNGKPK